jgi:hypothetical protein
LKTYKVLPFVGAGALVAHLVAAAAFRRRIDEMIARLGSAVVAETSSSTVPAIIESFTRRAVSNSPVPNTVHLRQFAEMRATLSDPWRPLTAEQVISVHEPGFVWLARIQAAPLLFARILDCYVGGEGLLEVRLLGSLRLTRAAGPQISRGELMRYLAELAWAPHAMRQNPYLSWREIDETTVEVSAESVGGPARVRMVFENGDIVRIEADDRPRAVGSRMIPTPWRGHLFDYREIDGCRIPTRAVVSWLLDEGTFDCWRGKVTAFTMKLTQMILHSAKCDLVGAFPLFRARSDSSFGAKNLDLDQCLFPWFGQFRVSELACALSERRSTISSAGGRPEDGYICNLHPSS